MSYKELNYKIGNIDIYLLDQILKGRFEDKKVILDAGCGEGRNLKYFFNNSYEIHGIDTNPMAIKLARMQYTATTDHFVIGDVQSLPWEDSTFDAVICSAVLHFVKSEEEFDQSISEMVRVLKRGGLLFIRMVCDVGVTPQVMTKQGFTYILTKDKIGQVLESTGLEWVEPFKTVLVDGKRSMATLILQK